MESELRTLIGKYGMRAVHEGLRKEMQETFAYLQSVFHEKNEIVLPLPSPVPKFEIRTEQIPDHMTLEEGTLETDSLDEESAVEVPVDPTVKHISIGVAKAKAVVPVVKQPKHQHREEVDKKRQELIAKGVKPETLLTEENLRKWLGQGYSYQKIAKETGVHEVQVSNTCKSFGLQSSISRYVAMKKTGGKS